MIHLTGFRFCPRCGAEKLVPDDGKSVRCTACGFLYFHNMAAAVMGILVTPSGILLGRRAEDPGKGLLDLPGGFADYGESLEEALIREIQEELGFRPAVPEYIGSFPNTYVFGGVTYHTSDAVFKAVLPRVPDLREVRGELTEVLVRQPEAIQLGQVAFDSARKAILLYRELIQ
ncbi:MAG: NUDIX domain-containing protein [Acidobacteriota bacterium]|nr:NUDIX domain-containing protein [Acidobacteriota bacterium]